MACDYAQDGDYCENDDTETYELGENGRHYDLCPQHAPTNHDPINDTTHP